MAGLTELGQIVASKLKFTSVLAVIADLSAVVPLLIKAYALYFNTLDLGVVMTLTAAMFNWCGTALRVLCIRFKYW